MNTLAMHDKSSHPRYNVKKTPQQRRQELLMKRTVLDQRHRDQSEALLRKHHEERNQIENHPNFTEEEMEYVISNVMEPMHEKQLRLMQERQQKEQAGLMDLMFASAFGADAEEDTEKKTPKLNNRRTTEPEQYERKDPPELLSAQNSVGSSHVGTINAAEGNTSLDQSEGNLTMDASESYTTRDTSASYSTSATSQDTSTAATSIMSLGDSPFYHALQQLKLNDYNLQSLSLDGHDKIPKRQWKSLFEILEKNNRLKRLSLAACGLTDEVMVPLALALVENDTLRSISLADNPGIGDATGGMFLKVLARSNEILHELDVTNTSISDEVKFEIEAMLKKRVEASHF
jgi:hypothetical protein